MATIIISLLVPLALLAYARYNEARREAEQLERERNEYLQSLSDVDVAMLILSGKDIE